MRIVLLNVFVYDFGTIKTSIVPIVPYGWNMSGTNPIILGDWLNLNLLGLQFQIDMIYRPGTLLKGMNQGVYYIIECWCQLYLSTICLLDDIFLTEQSIFFHKNDTWRICLEYVVLFFSFLKVIDECFWQYWLIFEQEYPTST